MNPEEREAIDEAANICDWRERRSMELRLPDEAEHWRQRAATLRGMLSPLPEPPEEHYADVLDRIAMLLEHLDYTPSQEWIHAVLAAAHAEIAALRVAT